MSRAICAVLAGVIGLIVLIVNADLGSAAGLTSTGEEFAGPFASWRQVTCGGVDDTALLQSALNAVGMPGQSPVLYVTPGTCVIHSTLYLAHKQYITVLGADPARVTIRWAGPRGGEMLHINGVAYSRFGRITWDGAGTAGTIYRLRWDGSSNYFPTGNRHEDEVFENADFGIRAGADGGGGEAETSLVRCYFHDLRVAGVNLEDWNALDWWIWWSRFERTHTAVTNNYFGRAGNFHVYHSVFLNNSAGDLTFTNTGMFSARGNWSSGSAHFLYGGPIGSAPALVSMQGNTIYNTTDVAVLLQDPGPLTLVDNVFATGAQVPVAIQEAYTAAVTGDLVSIGNTYQVQRPYLYVRGRVHHVDDTITPQLPPTVQSPRQPSTPPTQARQVFEPLGGDIQAAIDAAIASLSPRPIVHIPYGTYAIARTLVVPANADVQLVGDGRNATVLRSAGASPVLLVHGPSHAVMRDLLVDGANQADGLVVDTADSSGGLVHAEEVNASTSDLGLLVRGLTQTRTEFVTLLAGNNPGTAMRVDGGSRVSVFGGATAANNTTFDVRDQSTLTVTDIWNESGSTHYLAAGGSGRFTWDGGVLASQNPSALDGSRFTGVLTLVNQGSQNGIIGGANALLAGIVAPDGTWSDASQPWALIATKIPTQGGGSRPAPESAMGIVDQAGFMRDHFVALRGAVTADPSACGPLNDVRLYRVAIDHARVGLRLTSATLPPASASGGVTPLVLPRLTVC